MPFIHEYVDALVDLTQRHADWAVPAVFCIAFAESLVMISLVVPATVMFLALGALVSSGVVGFWEMFAAAVTGAILGNTASYRIGRRFKHSIARIWLFRKRPDLLAQGHKFFQQHGGKSVFIGRFFGPTRAVIPLIAGMTEMPVRRFLVANALSAVVWILLSIGPGLMGGLVATAAASNPAAADGSVPSVPLR